MIPIYRRTSATLRGTVYNNGQSMAGWRLTLETLPPNDAVLKDSSSPSEILFDTDTGEYQVFLTPGDTTEVRSLTVELRAHSGSNEYLLLQELLVISP